MDEYQEAAVQEYNKTTGRSFVPGDSIDIPTDALAFTKYQHAWTELEEFKSNRCIYDSETNDELICYVTEFLLGPEIPPIYIDILEDGVALVDGVHRVTAAFISGQPTIRAQINISL
jgi:hypothetical protein